MGALVSLPFLSFLLLPTVTSYSTSLNLLFFYLTWSTLILSHSPLLVELVGSFAVRILLSVAPNVLFLAFDALLPSAAERMKYMGQAALPLKDARRQRLVLVGKVVLWSLFNLCLGVLVQVSIEVLLTQFLGLKSALRVTTTLPMPVAICKDIFRGWLAREVLGYTIHRFGLHNRHQFPLLSTYHETWYHSLAAPIPLSASYDHPLAYLLRNFIPTFFPAYLFRFHLLTYLVFLALVSLEETFVHSGYSNLPTNFLFGGIARRVESHLVATDADSLRNTKSRFDSHSPTNSHLQPCPSSFSGYFGNFGPWGILDWIFGTTLGADVVADATLEVQRQSYDHDLVRLAGNGKTIPPVAEKVRKRIRGGSVGISGSEDGIGGPRRRPRSARNDRYNGGEDDDDSIGAGDTNGGSDQGGPRMRQMKTRSRRRRDH